MTTLRKLPTSKTEDEWQGPPYHPEPGGGSVRATPLYHTEKKAGSSAFASAGLSLISRGHIRARPPRHVLRVPRWMRASPMWTVDSSGLKRERPAQVTRAPSSGCPFSDRASPRGDEARGRTSGATKYARSKYGIASDVAILRQEHIGHTAEVLRVLGRVRQRDADVAQGAVDVTRRVQHATQIPVHLPAVRPQRQGQLELAWPAHRASDHNRRCPTLFCRSSIPDRIPARCATGSRCPPYLYLIPREGPEGESPGRRRTAATRISRGDRARRGRGCQSARPPLPTSSARPGRTGRCSGRASSW